MIESNLRQVQARVAACAQSSSRDPAQIALIGVTKGVAVESIQAAVAAGLTQVGENRVQEAQEKKGQLDGRVVPSTGVRWHLIGHLQRNKAKAAVTLFDVIHSVDSMELVEVLDRQAGTRRSAAPERRSPLKALIQVNVAGEATKHGCRPEEAEGLAKQVAGSQHLSLVGLMTMPPYSEDPEASRPVFRQLRELRDELRDRLGVSNLGLSMGMSQDFEVAIQEGATMVRVGTAIFGDRAR